MEKYHWEYNGILDTLFSKAPNKDDIIMNKYVNYRIGRRYQEEYSSVLVINSSYGRNTRGENLLEIYRSNNLRVENNFYTQENYTTYVSKGLDKTPSMHGILNIDQTKHKRIRDRKAVNYGADSDHTAVAIKLAITSIKLNHNVFIKRVTDWMKILTDEGYAALYCETLKYLVNEITSRMTTLMNVF